MSKEDLSSISGLVINIQHFCTNDGPGIRTTVFLKGCSLRCKWCSNPESIHKLPEIAYNQNKCIGASQCGFCLKPPCPEGGFYVLEGDDKVHINWELADENPQIYADVCPTGAIYLFGQLMTVQEVIEEVEQDAAFYQESGGGITISGGECLLQPDFTAAILAEAHQRGMNTAIETAGNVPWENMARVLPHVDLMLHDHKLTDPQLHKKWCGVDNARIKENFKRAYETFPNTRFKARTPLIPGINDDDEHIDSVLAFIRPYANVIDYELLPYHRFGESKYGYLGRVYELEDFDSPCEERLKQLRARIDRAFGRSSEN